MLEQISVSKFWKPICLSLFLGMAGKKNMKNFEATFFNMKEQSVAKEEFMARNHTTALRKANRKITKNIRVLSVEEVAGGQVSA